MHRFKHVQIDHPETTMILLSNLITYYDTYLAGKKHYPSKVLDKHLYVENKQFVLRKNRDLSKLAKSIII